MTRTAVVSGGGTGIGRAIARAVAEDCSTVVIVGRRAEPLMEAAAAICDEVRDARVETVQADLRDPAQVAAAAERVGALADILDVLVNNAGGNLAPRPAGNLAGVRDDWQANFEGNTLPAVLLTHALLPLMRRPGGRIVTISSIAALRGPASYGGAKAALHPWSADLATTLAPEGITVNVVAPGYIAGTDFYGERDGPELRADRARRAAAGRMGEPGEVASLVRYLVGEGASYVTGQILQANGGALLGRG